MRSKNAKKARDDDMPTNVRECRNPLPLSALLSLVIIHRTTVLQVQEGNIKIPPF